MVKIFDDYENQDRLIAANEKVRDWLALYELRGKVNFAQKSILIGKCFDSIEKGDEYLDSMLPFFLDEKTG